ncbi:MAG: hypothetical protein GTO51_02195 [Candidatus Latescibacteria bacterium]|nr:hypothetical protein [Candidatus Latescibacterota bacterium]NIM22424.1 hypothetical protein [Candidatus Latescibacterota bacterium]NIM64784.1 hypothetical protein [Candidatus Latescibacterota bacterium]NIO01295.1 hypothetical protein [Candidatus Latescibacterota bacterium]NIO27787.1 hypothetical protein [Candidatus Latescibacterota bacterium]
MKRTAAIVLAISLVGLWIASAGAQGNVMLYFDPWGSVGSKDCPPIPSMIDSAYVYAKNFDMWLSAVEYKVDYPPQMIWLSEVPTSDLTIGNTRDGIAQAWQYPQNAFTSLKLVKIVFAWNCTTCGTQDIPILVNVNPHTGGLTAIRWPDNAIIPGVGMVSLICATVSTDVTSWGKIKALYNQ